MIIAIGSIALILLVFASLWFATRGLPSPVAPNAARLPRCGRCRYLVIGLETFICPECGSDLRQVGIDVGKVQRRCSMLWLPGMLLMIGWTVAAWIGGTNAVDRMNRIAARERTTSFTATLAKPRSGAYEEIQITGNGTHLCRGNFIALQASDIQQVRIKLTGRKGELGTMTVDLEKPQHEIASAAGQGEAVRGTGFGREAVFAFLSRMTSTQESHYLDLEASEIALLIQRPVDQQQNMMGSRSSTVSSGGSETRQFGDWTCGFNDNSPFSEASGDFHSSLALMSNASLGVIAAAFAIWAAGIWAIVRWARRIKREP